jgi:hypothetical protein
LGNVLVDSPAWSSTQAEQSHSAGAVCRCVIRLFSHTHNANGDLHE